MEDKRYSIEEDAKEYLDRCEKIYQEEGKLLYSIVRQCSNKNCKGVYKLALDTKEFNNYIYHFILPSGLHIYSNCEHGIAFSAVGALLLSHELPQEVLKNSRSFLQLTDGVDAFVQLGEAGNGADVTDGYIKYGINGHCIKDKDWKDDYTATSDIETGFKSSFYRYGKKGYGKYGNRMMISRDGFTALDISEKYENLLDVLKGVIKDLPLSDKEKQDYYHKIEPLFKMLEIERNNLQQQESKKSPLQQREEELSLLEAEKTKLKAEIDKQAEQEGQNIGEE